MLSVGLCCYNVSSRVFILVMLTSDIFLRTLIACGLLLNSFVVFKQWNTDGLTSKKHTFMAAILLTSLSPKKKKSTRILWNISIQ